MQCSIDGRSVGVHDGAGLSQNLRYIGNMSRRRPIQARGYWPAIAAIIALQLTVGASCPKRATDVDTIPAASQQAEKTSTAPRKDKPVSDSKAPAPPPPIFAKVGDGKHLAVVVTASVQGYVAPCGCTAEPLGGIGRFAAAMGQARQAYGDRVLFLDAGDLLFEKLDDNLPADACQTEARHELLLATYAQLGLAATVLGPLDDVRGAKWRDGLMAKHGISTIGVGPTLRALSNGAKIESSRIFDAGPNKVGVTAVTLSEASKLSATKKLVAKEVSSLNKQGADVVIVLSQATPQLSRSLLDDMAGIDAVVVGHEPGELPSPPEKLSSGAAIVYPGLQSQHFVVLEMSLDGRDKEKPLPLDDSEAKAAGRTRLLESRVKQYEKRVAESKGARADFVRKKLDKAKAELEALKTAGGVLARVDGPHLRVRAIELTRARGVHEATKKKLDAYEASVPQLVASCEANIVCEEAKPGQPVYIGTQGCIGCHRQAFTQWREQHVEVPGTDKDGGAITRKLGHALAWDTLVDENKDSDRTCVGCHSVGFNEPGGYCRVSDIGFRTGVQCESCHGPGSLHAQNNGDTTSLQPVTEATCRGCHQVPHIPTTESFVFEEKLRSVLGPGHGAFRLKELDHGGR